MMSAKRELEIWIQAWSRRHNVSLSHKQVKCIASLRFCNTYSELSERENGNQQLTHEQLDGVYLFFDVITREELNDYMGGYKRGGHPSWYDQVLRHNWVMGLRTINI